MIRIVGGPIDRNAVIEGASSSKAGAIVTFGRGRPRPRPRQESDSPLL